MPTLDDDNSVELLAFGLVHRLHMDGRQARLLNVNNVTPSYS